MGAAVAAVQQRRIVGSEGLLLRQTATASSRDASSFPGVLSRVLIG
jgi:hypothetical protein